MNTTHQNLDWFYDGNKKTTNEMKLYRWLSKWEPLLKRIPESDVLQTIRLTLLTHGNYQVMKSNGHIKTTTKYSKELRLEVQRAIYKLITDYGFKKPSGQRKRITEHDTCPEKPFSDEPKDYKCSCGYNSIYPEFCHCFTENKTIENISKLRLEQNHTAKEIADKYGIECTRGFENNLRKIFSLGKGGKRKNSGRKKR